MTEDEPARSVASETSRVGDMTSNPVRAGRPGRVLLFVLTAVCGFIVLGLDAAHFGRAVGQVWDPNAASLSLLGFAVTRGVEAAALNPLNLVFAVLMASYVRSTAGRSRLSMAVTLIVIFAVISVGTAFTAYDRARSERAVVPRTLTPQEARRLKDATDRAIREGVIPNAEGE